MSQIKGQGASIVPQDLYASYNPSSPITGLNIGDMATTGDGRVFRWALAGATTLVPGKLNQAPAQDTTNQNPSGGLSVAAAAIGATQVTITSSITLAANLLAGGFMSVNVTPGQGYTYKVKGNTAVTSAANCVVTLEDPIVVALTTASKVVFTLNPYNGVIVAPTTLTSTVVGWPIYAVVNGQYGWIQTHGPCSMLGDAGTSVGAALQQSTNTIGSTITATAGKQIVASAIGTFVTTEYDLGFALID